MPETPEITPTPPSQPAVTAEPVTTGLISFAEPAAEVDPAKVAAVQTVEEVEQAKEQSAPEPVEQSQKLLPLTQEEMGALHRSAENDDMKRDFTLKVLAARKPPEEPAPPPPVASRVAEQTAAEMSAGAKLVAKRAEENAKRNHPAHDKWEGRSASVYRPEDYVPNLKSQGHVGARNL